MNNKPEQIKDNYDKLMSVIDEYFEDDQHNNIKSLFSHFEDRITGVGIGWYTIQIHNDENGNPRPLLHEYQSDTMDHVMGSIKKLQNKNLLNKLVTDINNTDVQQIIHSEISKKLAEDQKYHRLSFIGEMLDLSDTSIKISIPFLDKKRPYIDIRIPNGFLDANTLANKFSKALTEE